MLFVGQISGNVNVALNLFDPDFFRFTIFAIGGINSGMAEMNDNVFHGPPFAARVQRDRHRSAGSERRQQ